MTNTRPPAIPSFSRQHSGEHRGQPRPTAPSSSLHTSTGSRSGREESIIKGLGVPLKSQGPWVDVSLQEAELLLHISFWTFHMERNTFALKALWRCFGGWIVLRFTGHPPCCRCWSRTPARRSCSCRWCSGSSSTRSWSGNPERGGDYSVVSSQTPDSVQYHRRQSRTTNPLFTDVYKCIRWLF